MTNMTEVVCNGGQNKGKQSRPHAKYRLERQLRNIGKEKGAYVLGIFDCCREQLTDAMRGAQNNDPDDVEMDVEDYHNFILWFGCPAGSGVDATSTIATGFFEELRRNARKSDGSVVLPRDLMTSRIGREGEFIPQIVHQIKLQHKDWDAEE